MECKKQRANNWRIRLMEEIRHNKDGKFVTMTFTDEELIKLEYEIHKKNKKNLGQLNKITKKNTKYIPVNGYDLDNEIATLAVRRFLERYRKQHGTSIKHWLVTELGQESTERLHIHGIIWTSKAKTHIEKIWKYGTVNRNQKQWEDNYCTERTINYIVKYINKTDEIHKYYNPIILTSSGIGKQYVNRPDSQKNKFKGEDTKESYITRQGYKLPLPTYYRNKIYTEDEREMLWINLLNKEVRWVNGIKVDISKGEEDYNNLVKHARTVNKTLGYGNNIIKWDELKYEQQRRNIKKWTREQKQKRSF
ncbi:MAG: replication initiator protein [Microviridae sp.]|nr:MAG: replication initiator protein [Microviridae sp.]